MAETSRRHPQTLCSLAIIVMEIGRVAQDPGALMLPLLFGGVPFLIGLGAFWLGRVLVRDTGGETGPEERSNEPPAA